MHRAWQTLKNILLAIVVVAVVVTSLQAVAVSAAEKQSPQQIDLFDGMHSGDLQVRYVPKNDREAQIIVKNNTQRPLSVKLPDAFAGVPVLAQVGGGRSSSRSSSSSGSSGAQSSGGGGGGSRGGGGGVFNVAPEAVSKVKVPIVCLEHGKDDPNDHIPYEIRPIESFTSDARVQELLKMLGNGEIDQRAAQAATWHFTNNMSWNDLAAKKLNHVGRETYFTKDQMQAAVAIAARSEQLAKGHLPEDAAPKTTSPSDSADSSDAISSGESKQATAGLPAEADGQSGK